MPSVIPLVSFFSFFVAVVLFVAMRIRYQVPARLSVYGRGNCRHTRKAVFAMASSVSKAWTVFAMKTVIISPLDWFFLRNCIGTPRLSLLRQLHRYALDIFSLAMETRCVLGLVFLSLFFL